MADTIQTAYEASKNIKETDVHVDGAMVYFHCVK